MLQISNEPIQIVSRNRIGLSWNIDKGSLLASIVLEVVSEQVRVDGRTHQQNLGNVKSGCLSRLEHSLEDDQQKVRIEISLVNFVQDDVRHRVKPCDLVLM